MIKSLYFFIVICLIIFFVSLYSFVLHSTNFIFFILLNEVLVFTLMLLFLVVGFIFDDLSSQIFVLFILVISSCEVVIGLSLIVAYTSSVTLSLQKNSKVLKHNTKKL